MLDTVPSLPHSKSSKFMSTLTTNLLLFQHYLRVLGLLITLMHPSAEPRPTPTIFKPFPISRARFTFPRVYPPMFLRGS
ncbi:hypothetical protein PILCRDRAFT_829515 [Piloderma croceum F 1598]|uniref:Uncharacterized protein n=1 Tax=Piloderma croceum (strain F 1598) TaxID=765440 RepID=A0A0C3EJV6_PILCF|nr:hypothetical protein PILCRDRAFT_829515 [Piloderma croceum F 1598]